jgi:hypothetical protein
VAVIVVLFINLNRKSNFELCGVNLRTIDRSIRAGEALNDPRWDAAHTGRRFLADPSTWPTRQRIPMELSCPVLGKPGSIDYRGPATSLRHLELEEPMCADRPGNHGPGAGGNVLLKSGRIFPVAENHALWALADRTTSD